MVIKDFVSNLILSFIVSYLGYKKEIFFFDNKENFFLWEIYLLK